MDKMLVSPVKGKKNCQVNEISTPSVMLAFDLEQQHVTFFWTFFVRGMLSNEPSRPDKLSAKYCGSKLTFNTKCGDNLCR